jgi:hypothetical protein
LFFFAGKHNKPFVHWGYSGGRLAAACLYALAADHGAVFIDFLPYTA